MDLFRRLRRSFASPAPDPVTRRRFFAGAGVGAAALLGADVQAAPLDIEPGTLVDAQGRPLSRSARAADPILGEIMMFAGNFAPRGWAQCNGSLLPINTNQALFSIIGTIYGGDGRTTFALPDLRGRAPIHYGTGPGLSNRVLGQRGGSESHTLTPNQLPPHDHGVPGVQVRGTGTRVVGAAEGGERGSIATGTAGGGQPVDHVSPFLAINFIIALVGVYPSRS